MKWNFPKHCWFIRVIVMVKCEAKVSYIKSANKVNFCTPKKAGGGKHLLSHHLSPWCNLLCLEITAICKHLGFIKYLLLQKRWDDFWILNKHGGTLQIVKGNKWPGFTCTVEILKKEKFSFLDECKKTHKASPKLYACRGKKPHQCEKSWLFFVSGVCSSRRKNAQSCMLLIFCAGCGGPQATVFRIPKSPLSKTTHSHHSLKG